MCITGDFFVVREDPSDCVFSKFIISGIDWVGGGGRWVVGVFEAGHWSRLLQHFGWFPIVGFLELELHVLCFTISNKEEFTMELLMSIDKFA